VKSTGDRETAPGSKQIVLAFLAVVVATCILAVAAPAGAFAFGPVSGFGLDGTAAGQTQEPRGVALAADGSVYVADDGNNRIDVFSSQGAFLFAFGKGVRAGMGDTCTPASGCMEAASTDEAGGMAHPFGVDIASTGDVYVADENNNRIDVFSSQGTFLFAFGKGVNPAGGDVCTAASGCQEGKADGSAGAIHRALGLAIGAGGNVNVADTEDNRIDVFSPQGTFLFAFGKAVNLSDNSDRCTSASGCKAGLDGGVAGELGEPVDVSGAPGGRLAVTNYKNNRVDVFSDQGVFLYGFGKAVNAADGSGVCTALSGCQASLAASSAGAMSSPSAIDVGSSGLVYVTETGNSRVSEFTLDGSFVRAFGESVANPLETFQVCDLSTGCRDGKEGTIAGAVPNGSGVAIDCRGAVYVSELSGAFSRVERFAEPETGPCPVSPQTNPPARPSNRFRFVGLKLNRRKGTATLIVSVPAPGALALKGARVHGVKRVAKRAGNVKLPIKLTGKAKSRLAKSGRAKVKAQVTFAPTGGTPLTKAKTLGLRRVLG
jgi:DNA-binding beta-propeller fold protein YncE